MDYRVPDYHCRPKSRLLKPICLSVPDYFPPSPFHKYEFHEVSQIEARKNLDLIFDPLNPTTCTNPRFSGDFESGNLGQVFCGGKFFYEIHLLPDPNDTKTRQWFFFKVENIDPGEYTFVIVGFYRQCNLHWKGSQAVVYSENAASRGVGWQRIGYNLNYFQWKSGKNPQWAFQFQFTVSHRDTMYFAHSYPYTYTDLNAFLHSLPQICKPSNVCKSLGDIDLPGVFWDADQQKCLDIQSLYTVKSRAHSPPAVRIEEITEFNEVTVELLRRWRDKTYNSGVKSPFKPVIIIVGRTHPGETNSSYAMEGLMTCVFSSTSFGQRLRENFSWLIIPMINPDGVICGFYRPSLGGNDMNRVWQSPSNSDPEASHILDLLESLQQKRPLLFFLDFHGHTAACNSFVYGFMNEQNQDLYAAERVFPLLMTKHTPLFSNEMCSFLKQKTYEGTMRVVVRRRFLVLFAYTLEMSYGGCDFGPRRNTQFTPHDYRSIGEATAHSIADLFLSPNSLAAKEVMLLMPPPDSINQNDTQEKPQHSQIIVQGETKESNPGFFSFSPDDIKITKPSNINLTLKQVVRD